jgi:NHLM bacteriocin system ABC transporter peptidase/ATP-binding protein
VSEDLTKVSAGAKRSGRVHTPTVLQMEAVECGAAALASVLGYYRRFVPLEKLRVECGVSRDGSSARGIVQAARNYGLKAQGKKLAAKDLSTYAFPSIVHWDFEHFLVVDGLSATTAYLNDPAEGPREVPFKEFEESFTGVAVVFEKSDEFKPGGQPSSLVYALRQRLRGSEMALVYVVLVSVLLVIPGLALPTFVRTFVDKVLVAGLDGWIPPLLLGLGLAALVSGALTALQQYALRALETRFSLGTSARFFWHVLRLPMEFYSQRYAGDVGSRVALNDHVAELLSGQLATALLNILVVALYAGLMFSYDVGLTLISLAIAAANIVVLTLVSRKRKDGNSHLLQQEGKLVGTAVGGLQIIETLKATGTEAKFFSRWAGQQAKVLNARQTLGIYTQILQVAPSALTMLNTALILWIGAEHVIDGRMTIGMLVAFQTLALTFMAPVTQLVGLGGSLQEVAGSLARLDDVLRYETDDAVSDQVEPVPDGPVRLTGRLELRDLVFGYNSLEPPLIEGFSLTLNPGDRVAIVGGTGSGKSTLTKLIAGLHRPWAGEVLFDGEPREKLSRRLLTNSLAHVDQDIVLFEGTLRENLSLWDPTVSETDVILAARDAVIHDDIMDRANGYNTTVSEGGSNFSGGQRQRLEIARALTGNPAILLLDEATSALDPIVESAIDSNLRRRGCTCVIVAHRLSTVRDCDEIVVLDRGKVVERGTHAEMMKNDGPYQRLIRAELAEAVTA